MRTSPTMIEVSPIKNDYFFLCWEIQELYPEINQGCRNSAKALIRKHAIPESAVISARPKIDKDFSGEWIYSSTHSTQKDKRMISVSYFEDYLNPDREDDFSEEECDGEPDAESSKRKTLPRLPKEIVLGDSERFRDPEDDSFEIKMFGNLELEEYCFNVGEVEKAFKLHKLAATITHPSSAYRKDLHYLIFDVSNSNGVIVRTGSAFAARTKNATHYLTHLGMARVLFSYGCKTADPFLAWMVKTLFGRKLGTSAKRLQDYGAECTKMMSNVISGKISCIYLFTLGKVGDLRKTMSIGHEYPDSSSVYKFGRSKDLKRRESQHKAKYEKWKGVKIDLVYFGHVNEESTRDAEADVAQLMRDRKMMFTYQNSRELVIISTEALDNIKEDYDVIVEKYKGGVNSMTTALTKKEDDHKHELALSASQHETALVLARQETKDVKANAEIEILKTEAKLREAIHKNEILEYKLAAATATAR